MVHVKSSMKALDVKGVGKLRKCRVRGSNDNKPDNKNPTDSRIKEIPRSDEKLLQNAYSLGIMTRSGRIKYKNKETLKAMDNILKNELLIHDTKKPRQMKMYTSGVNNNNNNSISDRNKKKGVVNSLSQSKGNGKTGLKGKSKKKKPPETMDPSVREDVINKMKSVLSPDDELNQATNFFKPIPKTITKTKANKRKRHLDSMEPCLREEVINKMNDEFSLDTDLINSRRFVKNRPKSQLVPAESGNSDKSVNLENNAKQRKIEIEIDLGNVDRTKMKQVTLSNGLVLTLALVKCDYCQKSFSNKQSLARHMLQHVDLRPHKCPNCPRKFRHRSTLKIHLQRRHLEVQEMRAPDYYMCHICDKAFLMQENLELHLATHVKPENKAENNYQCLYCEKKFSYRLLLAQHEKSHLATNKFKCYICDMSFDCRNKLSHHIKSHKKVKDYICQYCGKEFLRSSGIKRHVRVCHSGQRVQCPICLKHLKGHLTEHMRVHEQKRPHVCDQCGQRFTQSTQLTVHKRSHNGDRPYNCRICNRAFGHSNALMLHRRRHTGEKPFICAMCPMTFSQLPHMKTHMSKIHGKEHAYKCQKCDEFFKLKSHLDTHMKLCTVGDKELSFEETIQASIQFDEVEVESTMNISKMRFLLALLLTMIASKDKLKYLGFNKRLIDDLLEESLSAMGYTPCIDTCLSPIKKLKANIEILLNGTVPKTQMEKFTYENKTTEEILVLLTGENN